MARPEAPTGETTVDLKGQTALVTGASRGLGRAIALAFGKAGANVACVARSADKLKETVDAVVAAGGVAEAFTCDVSQSSSVDEVVDKVVARFGGLQILVNNAGITRDAMFHKMTPEQWDAVIKTNLYSIFNTTKQVYDGMVARGWGRIINISSVNGIKGQAGQSNYSATKAAIYGFNKSLAAECAKKGVTVNSISPGYIGTDMVRAIREDVLQKIVATVPIGRLGEPSEIARTVAFLSADDAGLITGEDITVNGGLYYR